MLRHLFGGATAALLLVPVARSQTPAVPAVPAAPAPANIWSRILMTPEQKAACKAHLCQSPIVQFMGSMLTPMRAMSGGLMPRLCPGPLDPKPGDLAKPADSAEGAASRIKKSEAEAKARRAAVRYLGTVDCSRFPEAEAALVNGLRGDTNECVRYEAALALGSGCCCTKKVIQALSDAVSCKKTSDPAETSPRVRAAAAVALERCLARACPEEPQPPEKGVEPPKKEGGPEAGREEARRVLDEYRAATRRVVQTVEPEAEGEPLKPVAWKAQPVARAGGPVAPPTGRRDVWSLLIHSIR